MKILVTGGAGYIGSVAVKDLILNNFEVVVVDNLSKGKKELVDKKASLIVGDLNDKQFLSSVFKTHKFDCVIHFAGYKAVEESMVNAPKYSQNIVGTINLLDQMVLHKTKKIIFSSSAAVYGMSEEEIINEDILTNPINYYGFTKLEDENIIKWYNKIHAIDFIILRYFNVAGDGGLNYVDPDAKNIIPIIMEVIEKKRNELIIFGNDYNTLDGTCVRDYIHVQDLVNAHIKAISVQGSHIINLGSQKGFSVLDLVKSTEKMTKKVIPFKFGDRRIGDPAKLIATNKKAKEILNWEAKEDIDSMILSTYQAYFKKSN